jgi:hypothetical protein
VTARLIMTIHPPMSVTTFTHLLGGLEGEFPGAYMTPENGAFNVYWDDADTQRPSEADLDETDWPGFAADILSGDMDRLRRRMPDWLSELVQAEADDQP